MKRLLNIIRTFFISPEFIALLVVYILFLYFPTTFENIGKSFINPNEYIKYIALLPMAFTGIIFTHIIKSILFPEEKRKALYEWQDYFLLRDRVMIGAIISILCSVSCILIFLFQASVESKYVALIFISSILISSISVFTMFLATIAIREILISTDKKK